MNNTEHLNFIYERLKLKYNEEENLDYMLKFKSIIDDLELLNADIRNNLSLILNLTTIISVSILNGDILISNNQLLEFIEREIINVKNSVDYLSKLNQ
jgi:hypothetical protein